MKIKIKIEGMSCGHCVNHVKEALTELAGITSVDVSLEEKFALLESNSEVKEEDIKFAIEDVGYEVVAIEVLS